MLDLESAISNPLFISTGVMLAKTGENWLLVFKTTTYADFVYLKHSTYRSHHGIIDIKDLYRSIDGKPLLLVTLLQRNVAPDVLDNILTHAPSLRSSLNNPIDIHDWLSHCAFQEYNIRCEGDFYRSWWVTLTRLPVHLARGLETLKILVKHGADIRAVTGLSDTQKRLMLPEFTQSDASFSRFSHHRAAIISRSEYRKQSLEHTTKHNEDVVLRYDDYSNTVTMDESMAISIRLKQSCSREEILNNAPQLLALLEMTCAFKGTDQYACFLDDGIVQMQEPSYSRLIIDDLSKQLDYLLDHCVFGVSYSPANNYVDITFHLEYSLNTDSKKHNTLIPIRLPFSADSNHNAIESIEFMKIHVKKPLDIAMFFTYGYEFLSHQRPQNIMHLAVAGKKYPSIKYLISEGVDPLEHNPHASIHPPMVGILGDPEDPNLTFYLQRMSHRALEFFDLCLVNQFYQHARKIIIKSKEPFDYDSLCKRRPLDVERLIMTEAMDPRQSLLAGKSQSTCSPKVFAWYKYPDEHQFSIDPVNFKRILQFCPELMYAFVANSNLIKNYNEKFTHILLYALTKHDFSLIEFLISNRVNIVWPQVLNHDDMSCLYDLCVSRKKLRKIAVKLFAQWIKNQPSAKEVLPKTAPPTYLDKDAHLPISSVLNKTLETLSEAESTWLNQYHAIQEHMLYADDLPPLAISSLCDDSITALSTCPKPFNDLTHNAWLLWIHIGRDILQQRNKIARRIDALNTESITQDQYDTLVQSATRYKEKGSVLIESLANHERTFQSCLAQKTTPLSKTDDLNEGTKLDDVSVAKKVTKADTLVTIDNRLTYRRLLLAYYRHDFLPLGDFAKSMQISRFFVLLHEIQENMDSKFVVYPKLLPTVRNIYIHYGPFFKAEHINTLHENVAYIGASLHDNTISRKAIKQQVSRFIETAFTMALVAFNINHPSLVIDDTLKFTLHNCYHKVCPTVRMERLRSLLTLVNDSCLSFYDYTQATLSEKLQLHFIFLEIGEHLKADGLRILQACKQSYMDQEQHDLIVVRGKYLHTFLLDREGEHPASNILELSLSEEQFTIVRSMYEALVPCVNDEVSTLRNHTVFTKSTVQDSHVVPSP